MPIIAENITVSFQMTPAIHHIDMTFAEGESWAIFGPNGAGKSTFLNALMGLLPLNTGTVKFDGLKQADIAYLPQLCKLDRSQAMTVFELVATGLWYEMGFFKGINTQQRTRVSQALAQVGMEDVSLKQISTLSNGQFQRVLFARMLVQNAKFLLLDEPFNAVDAVTTFDLLQIINDCVKEGKAVVAVLHDYEQVRAYFDNTVLIAREIIASGKTADVLKDENLLQASKFRQDISDIKLWCNDEGIQA